MYVFTNPVTYTVASLCHALLNIGTPFEHTSFKQNYNHPWHTSNTEVLLCQS